MQTSVVKKPHFDNLKGHGVVKEEAMYIYAYQHTFARKLGPSEGYVVRIARPPTHTHSLPIMVLIFLMFPLEIA